MNCNICHVSHRVEHSNRYWKQLAASIIKKTIKDRGIKIGYEEKNKLIVDSFHYVMMKSRFIDFVSKELRKYEH